MSGLKSLFKKLWSGWMWFAQKLGHFNSLVLLSVFFVLVVGPTNLIVRLLRADLLKLRKGPREGEGYWLPVQSDNTTVDAWRRQF